MKNTADVLKSILYPSEEFTPIPFWFFNDEPNEEKIRRQLEDYVEKGVNGLVLHPRIGVPEDIPYLSDKYFEVVRFIVRCAHELKMQVVLYDEAMYPSGSAHGMVVAENPEYASKGIRIVQESEEFAGEEITRFADGSRLIYGFTGGTIRGIHFGEDDGEPGAPKSADILNADAVDTFIRMTHDRYYEELKEYFGNTVIAFFTDEPSALGRRASRFREWLPGLEKEILEQGGRLEDLKALFVKETNETTVIYHKLIKKYLREIFYKKLSDWCEGHGIALMGHPEVSDDVEEQLYFQIPGQDLIQRRVAPETGGLTEFDSVQAKLAADIARHLGRRRNANECFGICYRNKITWYFTGADMKWYIDWLGIRGVNLFVPHAFYYSVTGARKDERPPDVGPNNIWWPHYRKVSDYIKRLSYLMTDSVNGAKVAVLCHNNQVPYKELATLFENQVEFNYLPIALLPECTVKEGKLCIGDYTYEAVLNVCDPQWDDLVAEGVKIFHDEESLLAAGIYKTVCTVVPCKDLRVSKLKKDNVELFVFSNEGEQPIRINVDLLSDAKNAVLVDLWRGEAKAVEYQDDGTFRLVIHPRETRALIPADEAEIKVQLKDLLTEGFQEKDLGDLTAEFKLVEKKQNQAIYQADYFADDIDSVKLFKVSGEEMVECYCNGELVDVSLWSPHRLRIDRNLQIGNNKIKLVVTGNAANIYCNAEIPYGLNQ